MITALAMGGRILDNQTYLEAATKAASFVLSGLRHNDKLLHRYRDGEAAVEGMLCDYAFVVRGLLELYAANFDPALLQDAVMLNQRMLDLFWDSKSGGFFLTPEDGETLLVRPKEIYDGAIPSGNSMALHNLLQLERLTGNTDLGMKAKLLVQFFSNAIQEVPSAYSQFLAGFYFAISPTIEIVIVGDPEAPDTRDMLFFINSIFSPHVVTLVKDPAAPGILVSLAPFTESHTSIGGKATAYVCRNFSCGTPTTEAKQLKDILAD